MRGTILLFATGVTSVAWADPLGTKASPTPFQASPMGAGPILQMILALGLVGVGVKFALPWIVARLGGRINTPVNGSIRVEESANFPGGKLYVVEARGRTLLLGATAQNVSCLADLTVNDFAEALAVAEAPIATAPLPSVHDTLARLERLGR